MDSDAQEAAQEVEILLVEDDAADAELVMRALARNKITAHTLWLKDGQAAMDFLFCAGSYAGRDARVRPRLVLLDIMLPKLTGIEVLAKIKSDPRTREVPVVMLTSSGEGRDVRACYQLGVNSYIVKPMDFGDFIHVVRDAGNYWMRANTVCDT